MAPRKVDWVIEEWNKETELPDEVKKVMYDLYAQNGSSDIYSYDDFFDLDLSFVGMRKTYYKKAVILLRKEKIQKLKDNLLK